MSESFLTSFSPPPYPGLRSFDSEETDIFFGREAQSDQLIGKLQGETHFLAVLGPSGSGKSSLVRTGLLAGLRRGYLEGAGTRWRVADMRPERQPLVNLAQALLKGNALPEYSRSFTTENPVAFLVADLWRGPWSIHELLRNLAVPANENLLLIIDQFEEIFPYHDSGATNEAAAFVELLLASSIPWVDSGQPRHRLYVVITMRSEFIGECTRFYGLPEAINQGLFLVPRLTRDQLREVIEGPARVFGGQVETGLVTRLLNEVGTNPNQLQLLQQALVQMWQLATQPGVDTGEIRLTLEHYQQIGPLTHFFNKTD